MRISRIATAFAFVVVVSGPAWAQADERQSRFVSFVEQATAGANALEQKARDVARDVAESEQFARAERRASELSRDVAAFAESLGDAEQIDVLTNDMRAWIEENRARINDLKDLKRSDRAELRALWRDQDAIVSAIGERLKLIQALTEDELDLLAREGAIRTEMAKAGAQRASKQAQQRAAHEITKLVRKLERLREDVERAAAGLSPAS